jgi:hypothetical protein
MIQHEILYVKADRLADRTGITDEHERAQHLISLTNQSIDDIIIPNLTEEEIAEDLAMEALHLNDSGELSMDNFMDAIRDIEKALALASNNKYVLEADYKFAEIDKDREKYLTRAIKVGEATFDKAYEEKHLGFYYSMHQTRSYMRLLFSMVTDFVEDKNYKPCQKLCERILLLNKNDNLGTRKLLAPLYLYHKQFDDFMDLLEKFEEESEDTSWLFNYALYIYLIDGDCPDADDAMESALLNNPFILAYLTNKKKLSLSDLPSGYSPHSEEEAKIYIYESLFAWRTAFGVQAWLKKF